ncbi:PilZ domain-containing protein [Ornithinibacillus californiensis]|uniref:PilZ domain-containing protein n=1 Tax=Ornithinibacillus californiensis TaxID=161536 RepID=UPI00064DDC78|nr:PilZ domain-containing protein [Ornithinibacillus californiensis]
MRYRRDEAFRFEFGEPLPIIFTIDEINGKVIHTSDGKATMRDLSLKGMKIATSLSLPFESGKDVKVTVQLLLNHHHYTIQGEIVWKKQRLQEYYYGIHYNTSENTKDAILDDIKMIGKRMA